MNSKIENDFLRIEASQAGGELKSVYSKTQNIEFLWQGAREWWPRNAPVLFPIVGKLNGNSLLLDGKRFSLPQHGFARDNEFAIEHIDDHAITYLLKSNEELLKNYPFPFELRIIYTLENNSVNICYRVKNSGTATQYFSIGAHPGFALATGETLEDYFIVFEETEVLDRHLLEDGLFNGKTERLVNQENTLPITSELFQKDAVVFHNMKSGFLYLRSRKSPYNLKFDFKGFPYFGIWSKPGASFICLEPWFGLADTKGFEKEFSKKEGIQSLEAGATFEKSFSVSIL